MTDDENKSDQARCPRCGAPLSAQARGNCPACLLRNLVAEHEPVLPFPSPRGYTLLAEIGRGGAGVVWKARQQGLDRDVALKVLAAGLLASDAERARLRREAEAMARLRHPHIVAIHEVGEVEGYLFIAMDLFEGSTLAERLRAGPIEPRAAAALVRDAADAVAHAHGRGVIHRDLKPANILLDQLGAPHLADFGLAKLLPAAPDSGAEPHTPFELTMTGHPLGTVHYMAPEQASDSPRNLGPPADIHALGAILYHCLTGRPPFLGKSFAETLRQLTHEEPPALRSLNPSVPRDLETVCQKCLRKEPGQRYANAVDLREDLDRFLGGRPVAARPAGLAERTVRLARRHPTGALLVSALALAVTGWLLSAQWQLRRLESANARLRERDLLHAMELAKVELDQSETTLAASRLARAAKDHPGSPLPLRRLAALLNQRAWLLLDAELAPDTLGTAALCFDPSGRTLALGQTDKSGVAVRLFSAADARQTGPTWRPGFQNLERLAFSPDGARLWASSTEGAARSQDVGPVSTNSGPPPDRPALASGDGRRRLLLTNANTGWAATLLVTAANPAVLLKTLPGETPAAQNCWSPSGQTPRFATEHSGGIRIRDGETGELFAEASEVGGVVQAVAWRPDGRVLAVAPLGGSVGLWSLSEPGATVRSNRANTLVRNLEWSPDGRFLAVSGDTPGAWLLDTAKNEPPSPLGPWSRAVFARRDNRLWLGGPSGRLAMARPPDWLAADLGIQLKGGVDRLALAHDDRWLGVATTNQLLCLVDIATGALRAGPAPVNPGGSNTWNLDRVLGLAFAPDGKTVAVASAQSVAGLWSVPELGPLFAWGANAPFTSAAFSSDGNWLALGSMLGSAWLVETATGKVAHRLPHPEEVFHVGFSADGHRLLAADRNGRVRVWSVPGGRLELDVKAGNFQSQWAGFTPADDEVAAVSFDGTVTWWDARQGQPMADPLSLGKPLVRACFQPGSRRLAVGGSGGSFWVVQPPVPEGAVPSWVPDLAEALVGVRILPDGSLEKLPPAKLLELRRHLSDLTVEPAWAALARRFASP